MNLPGLTGLRFLAAFYVFLFHIHLRTPLTFLPWQLKNLVNLGALGVNIFFVLSGFILTYGYHRKEFSFKGFLYKRMLRIYPAYLAGLLLCGMASFWFNQPVPVPIVAANLLLVQSVYYPVAMDWYGGGAWSVSTEMFFYLCFPFLLPFLLQIKRQSILWGLLLLVLALSSLPGFLFKQGIMGFLASYAFPLARLPEFVAGMLLGLLVCRFHYRVKLWQGLPLMAAALIYLVYFSPFLPGYTIHNIFILPGILAFIGLLIHHFQWVGSKPMAYLGKVSYSFYVVQISLMLVLDALLKQQKISPTDFAIGPMVLVINLLLAVLVYEGIEKPLHRAVKTS